MEVRHINALRRIYQADRMLAGDGLAPSSFHLVHRGAMRRMRSEIHHPRWDPSWAVPDELTIDDLEEIGILRVEPHFDKARTFVLTTKGHKEAAAVAEQRTAPVATDGRAPSAIEVLRWLVRLAGEEPACLDVPERLLDRAVTDKMIDFAGREPLAQRVLSLIEQGYLGGEVPDISLATSQQRVAGTEPS